MTTTPLDGARAVITGASSGIGLATAQALSAAGATVALVARNPDKLAAAAQQISTERPPTTIAADLSSQAGAAEMARQLKSSGPIDILIANAGASNAPELWDTTDAQFDEVIATNLKSTFFTIVETRDLLADDAAVILTSSVGYHRGRIGDPLYAAAKGAVRSLGRGFAADPDLLARGIRVNTISFGAVSTPMTGSDQPEMADALTQWAQDNVPMRRWAHVDEAAAATVFLASPAASYMTGAELCIDGGLAQI